MGSGQYTRVEFRVPLFSPSVLAERYFKVGLFFTKYCLTLRIV